MRWAGHVKCIEDIQNSYKIWGGKPEGKRHVGRPRHIWEDNIKMDQEIGWECADWIHLAHGKHQWQVIVNMVMISSGSIKRRCIFDQVSDY
jgi:hypothetical protein